MKRILFAAALILTFAVNAHADTHLKVSLAPAGGCGASHCANLVWGAPSDATAGSTYSAYQFVGACPATPPATVAAALASGWTKISGTPITGLTFTQGEASAGTYCFFVTQVQGGAESLPSNNASLVILPLSPVLQAPTGN